MTPGIETLESAPNLPNDNLIVVGRFNPEILQPDWIERYVFEGDEGRRTYAGMQQLGIGAPSSLIYRCGDLYWEPNRSRLRVMGPPGETGRFVRQVLKNLPHTPVSAAGFNFQRFVRASPPKIGPFHIDVAGERVARLLRGQPVETALSRVCVKEDGVRLTIKIQFAESETRALLDVNYHRQVASADPLEQTEELRKHAGRSEEFASDVDRITHEISE